MEASTVVEFSDSLLALPLVQGVCIVSTELAAMEHEQLLTDSKELKVFDELSVITDVESDGAQERDLLEVDPTMGLLECPQDKSIIFKECGDLTRGLMKQLQIQGEFLNLFMMDRDVDAKTTQVFDERTSVFLFTSICVRKAFKNRFFEDDHLSWNWQTRFDNVFGVAEAFEFLPFSCDPLMIQGDIKSNNVLLDSYYRAKISDFELLRIKLKGEFGVNLLYEDLRSQELGKSHELSGTFGGTANAHTPTIMIPMRKVVMFQSDLVWYEYKEWHDIYYNALRSKFNCLDNSINKLKVKDENDIKVSLVLRTKPVEKLHEIVNALFKIYGHEENKQNEQYVDQFDEKSIVTMFDLETIKKIKERSQAIKDKNAIIHFSPKVKVAACYASYPLKVLTSYSSKDARGLFKVSITYPNPNILLENDLLHDESFFVSNEVLESSFRLPIGKAKIEKVRRGDFQVLFKNGGPCFVHAKPS
ncbi:hypothetical protein V6N11_032738 [Hibiscus sabdariffa]|uniref:Protein kinase domain-containing protein n=1 Tax=Hibiscus sabdariffa TaxID=183260 RepID=A0ABR2T230_9ROSI